MDRGPGLRLEVAEPESGIIVAGFRLNGFGRGDQTGRLDATARSN
jgi:hypothetical protein